MKHNLDYGEEKVGFFLVSSLMRSLGFRVTSARFNWAYERPTFELWPEDAAKLAECCHEYSTKEKDCVLPGWRYTMKFVFSGPSGMWHAFPPPFSESAWSPIVRVSIPVRDLAELVYVLECCIDARVEAASSDANSVNASKS